MSNATDAKDASSVLDFFLKLSGLNTEATLMQRVERWVFMAAFGMLYYAWEKREIVVPALIGDDRVGLAAAAGAALLIVVRVVSWAGKRFDQCEQESRGLRESLFEVREELARAKSRMGLLERILFPDDTDPTDSDWVDLLGRHRALT